MQSTHNNSLDARKTVNMTNLTNLSNKFSDTFQKLDENMETDVSNDMNTILRHGNST